MESLLNCAMGIVSSSSETFIFFKAGTNMITLLQSGLEDENFTLTQNLLKRRLRDCRLLQVSLSNAIGFQKLSSSSHVLLGLNTSEEAEGRNVFNLLDLLKSSKDSQL